MLKEGKATSTINTKSSKSDSKSFSPGIYFGWYRDLVTDLPPLADGYIAPLDAPGLGLALREEVFQRQDVIREVSRVEDL